MTEGEEEGAYQGIDLRRLNIKRRDRSLGTVGILNMASTLASPFDGILESRKASKHAYNES